MNVVIDTSAIIAVIAAEKERDELVKLTMGTDLIAPASIYWEVGNAFSAMLKRRRISIDEALAGLGAYRDIPIRLVEVELDLSLKIAAELDIYAYDAYLISCANQFSSPLLTLDRSLQERAASYGVTVWRV